MLVERRAASAGPPERAHGDGPRQHEADAAASRAARALSSRARRERRPQQRSGQMKADRHATGRRPREVACSAAARPKLAAEDEAGEANAARRSSSPRSCASSSAEFPASAARPTAHPTPGPRPAGRRSRRCRCRSVDRATGPGRRRKGRRDDQPAQRADHRQILRQRTLAIAPPEGPPLSALSDGVASFRVLVCDGSPSREPWRLRRIRRPPAAGS